MPSSFSWNLYHLRTDRRDFYKIINLYKTSYFLDFQLSFSRFFECPNATATTGTLLLHLLKTIFCQDCCSPKISQMSNVIIQNWKENFKPSPVLQYLLYLLRPQQMLSGFSNLHRFAIFQNIFQRSSAFEYPGDRDI